ncbi:MAG: hypothetical protein J7L51_00525 [Desulfurococcales archaeon]|nr:hypothetical protein [Desulfurococcales archaeon]
MGNSTEMRSLPVLKKYCEVSTVVRVRVIAYLTLPEKLGWREKVVELNGENPTFEDLLKELPELRRVSEKYIREGSGLVILVNGHHVEFLGGLRARLKGG